MQGYQIMAQCPTFPFCEPGVDGGIGVDVLNGADGVSISNGSIESFSSGIVATAASRIFASNIGTDAPNVLTLTNVSGSIFTQIEGGTPNLGNSNGFDQGWLLSSSGGGNNAFVNLNGTRLQGIVISNSDHNLIDGADIDFVNEFQAGPGILLTNISGGNVILNNQVSGLFGNGIEVDSGSGSNLVEANTVSTTSPSGYYDLLDHNFRCDHNHWLNNTFRTASPTSCVN
jgi:hypothetical protein